MAEPSAKHLLNTSLVERRRSERIGATSITSDPPGSLGEKRKHGKEPDSSNKKAKSTPTPAPKKISAMVQSALYATERLCHAFWISHAINLVIIGKCSSVYLDLATLC
jgi:hypothetical protein